MQYWTTEEIEFLQKRLGLETYQLYLAFCNEYGDNCRTYHSVQKKIKKLRDDFSDEPPVEDTVNIQLSVEEWINTIRAKYEQYTYEPHIVESNQSTLCLVLSDLHFGKQTESFNLTVAKQRMLDISTWLSTATIPTIDEIVVMLVGDLVEGEDIYANQNGKIECSALEQMQACVESIWELVVKLSNMFEVPIRIAAVPGNHGRVSKTANEKSNWDNVVYHSLSILSANSPSLDISMDVNYKFFHTIQVKDKICLLNHEGVKHSGTPAPLIKIAGWTRSKACDFLVHGHWHQWSVETWMGTHIVANGCLCGPDDLSEKIAKEDNARQAYFFVTPGKPIHSFSYVEWENK